MADVVSRTGSPLQYLKSVHTPDFPIGQWIHNPDLSALVGVAVKYWKVSGDDVLEMTVGEKAAVDAAEAAALVTDNRADATNAPDDTEDAIGWRTRALIELFNKRDNFLTSRIVELQEDLQAIKASTGGTATIRNAIRASYLGTATRPRADAIQDYKDDIAAGGADT